jgi:hypothetical protein
MRYKTSTLIADKDYLAATKDRSTYFILATNYDKGGTGGTGGKHTSIGTSE